ncbi:MAG: helix-hairpin-helix domain-containing protein [Tissierellia bacterium]|nr:helix-hairpin-helix domain-containing protein [Tissierellia bacterium]
MNNHIYSKGLVVVLIIALFVMTSVGIKLAYKKEDIINSNMNENENLGLNDVELLNDSENVHEEKGIIIDIDGAVRKPGVYECFDGDRVNDIILKAGGLLENAYTKNINKARKLEDGEKIYILEVGEEISDVALFDNSIYNTGELQTSKININNASKEMLMTLEGIGEVYADRIIEYREKTKFKSIEEIKKIKGIGDKTFENIKDKITIK